MIVKLIISLDKFIKSYLKN